MDIIRCLIFKFIDFGLLIFLRKYFLSNMFIRFIQYLDDISP